MPTSNTAASKMSFLPTASGMSYQRKYHAEPLASSGSFFFKVTSSYQEQRLAKANGNFAFCLYRKVTEGAKVNNVFFYPFRALSAHGDIDSTARAITKSPETLIE
ncbi:hypothetical protein LSAT2_003746 [Lamellibrachia satsuma]|nr:hypothetical protein LSAT2_003746 [Lamellibrachia satsuma]